MDHAKEFHTMLAQTALLSNYTPDSFDDVIALYDRMIGPHGYEKAIKALESYIKLQRGPLRFPSVGEILYHMGIYEITEDDRSNYIANLIVSAISKIGPYEHEKFKEYVGPIGWEVVQHAGGIGSVCETQQSQLGFALSNWKKQAMYFIKKQGELKDEHQISESKRPSLCPGSEGPDLKKLSAPKIR